MPSSIDFDVTLRWPSRRQSGLDVRVTAPDGATLADVLPLLGDLVGSAPTHVSCRGVTVAPESPLGVPPLVHGATLVFDEPRSSLPPGSAPMDVVVVGGPDAGRRAPLTPDGLVIGRSAGLGLSLTDDRLSRKHARISLSDSGFRVSDLNSTNGTRCGGETLGDGGSAEVDGSELIAIGDSLLGLRRAVGTTAPTLPRGDGHIMVNRSPRTRPPELSVTVTAPTAPTPPRRGRIPWVAAALPLPFAGLLAVFFGPQMLAFALLSPLMLVGNVLNDRWGGRREYAQELAAHDIELTERRSEFDALRRLEREQRWRELPDPATVVDIATGPGTRLWERRRGAPDVGRVRLGVGELATRTGWAPDNARHVEHPLLPDLPVEVDLDAVGGLGMAGPPPEVEAMVRHVLGQVVTLHSPRDVRVIVRSHGGDGDACTLSWTRWLPHTAAYGDLATCLDALRHVVTSREAQRQNDGRPHEPRVLLVLPEYETDLGVGELLDLIERGRELGVWCLVGARTTGALPSSCHAVVGVGPGGGAGAGDRVARLDVDGAEPVAAFTPDQVGWWWGERIARSLAALVDATGEADVVPGSVDLLDLLPWLDDAPSVTAPALAAHWARGEGRPLARVGRLAGNEWTIDLASDGPHLLVGGTTGSGKSELLRTLVTSLALECSPEDMTFVLIDYKGGSAFGECADLPHTVGLVTNLDDGLARRALVSLGAEITRREGLLAESGARDHDDHRRRAGGLPRLVIVIDEFRLLADELPDFVDGMVSLAAVGRSLGVHLVLATQRPAGAITADIQANVNLRIAMRMRDVADSTDVIGAPDAAHLPSHLPGRGFARGGDGELREFQAARVGSGTASATTRVTVLDAMGRSTGRELTPGSGSAPAPGSAPATLSGDATGDRSMGSDPVAGQGGLAALASTTHHAAALVRARRPHRPWLPPLPDVLGTESVGVDGVGLLDWPAQQRQDVLRHADQHGHWLVVGGPRSGRTSTLRTILTSHVAEAGSQVHAYVIDTAGALADLETLPHVGAVVRADDVSRVRRLVEHLRSRTERSTTTPPSALPPVLLLVDGWERLDSDDSLAIGGLRDELLDLLRAGDNGLRAVITGDRSALSGRLSAISSETYLLPLADPSDATYAGLSRRDLPSSHVPGRGLRLRDRMEVQFALRDPLAEAAARLPRSPEPFALPQLPDVVDHALLLAGHHAVEPTPAHDRVSLCLPVGLSAETGCVAALDPERHGRRILVAGHARSGRSTTLAAIGRSAVAAGRQVAVVEGRGGDVGRTVDALVVVDPWDVQGLVDAKRRHPDLVVLVDDAERLDGSPVEPVLSEILAIVDRDGGFVVGATTPTAVATAFRGIVHAIARQQSGILLCPRTPSDGEAFSIRAPTGLASKPGRALLVSGRQHHEVQVGQVLPSNQVPA